MSENKRIRASFTIMTVQWWTITCFGLNFGRWRRTDRSKSRMETFTAELDVSSEIRRQMRRDNKTKTFLFVSPHTAQIDDTLWTLLSSNVLLYLFIRIPGLGPCWEVRQVLWSMCWLCICRISQTKTVHQCYNTWRSEEGHWFLEALISTLTDANYKCLCSSSFDQHIS